jgi:photosynthetic reaction center L subunit
VNPAPGDKVVKAAEHENAYSAISIGYSIGTLGIHRLGPVPWRCSRRVLERGVHRHQRALSGRAGWPEWWGWWLNLPILAH